MVKVLGWYDNEWGYSNRLVDLVEFVGAQVGVRDRGRSRPRSSKTSRSAGARGCLLRADFNVPLHDGVITDDLRITAALPTIEWLRGTGLLDRRLLPPGSTEGRARSRATPSRRSRIAWVSCWVRASSLAPRAVGADAFNRAASLEPRGVLLLENLRFDPGETANNPAFATNLSELGDVYVDDAFGAAHRSARVDRGPAEGAAIGGRAAARREVEVLGGLLDAPARPFVALLGGAKVSDKLGVIDALLERCDTVAVGGAMAFTFLLAQGHAVGESLVEPDQVDRCRALLETGRVLMPTDVVVAREMSDDARRRAT